MNDSGVDMCDPPSGGFWDAPDRSLKLKALVDASNSLAPVSKKVKSWHDPVKPGFYRERKGLGEQYDRTCQVRIKTALTLSHCSLKM